MEGILLIHPRRDEIEGIVTALRSAGYLVMSATDGRAGLEGLYLMPSDLVVVINDSIQGAELCSRIRGISNTPIVALCRKDEQSRTRMLELGADACMSMPVGNSELIARVRSLLRRYKHVHSMNADVIPESSVTWGS